MQIWKEKVRSLLLVENDDWTPDGAQSKQDEQQVVVVCGCEIVHGRNHQQNR